MPINRVGTRGIEDGAVATVDVAPGAVTSAKIADGGVSNDKLANSTAFGITLGASSTRNDRFISWQSVVTTDTTMVAGRGYFVDTSSGTITMTLPASAVTGDTIAIKDYTANFGTNKITIGRNGHNIQGSPTDATVDTNRASVELVYIDSTKGWLFVIESNVGSFAPFITASGGTETTSGDYKIHTFTGDGNFVVSNVGPSGAGNTVSLVVVAGGGGGSEAGGGAGGFRESREPSDPYSTSPLNNAGGLAVTAQTYPITVGGGGTGGTNSPFTCGAKGSNSVFSTITSTGGGAGAGGAPGPVTNGGSGGGGRGGYGGSSSPNYGNAGTGNTPPVSPSQGNPGGNGSGPAVGGGPGDYQAGGGGGATSAGVAFNATNPGNGGNGAGTGINPSCSVGDSGPDGSLRYFAGGGGASQQSTSPASQPASTGGYGGGGDRPHSAGSGAGTANTGGGGAGSRYNTPIDAGAGGKGIVIIRYKYQ